MSRTTMFIGSVLLITACTTTHTVVSDRSRNGMEQRTLDTVFVDAAKPNALRAEEEFQLPPYAPSRKRTEDLIHVRLDVSFDFEKEAVVGKAQLTFVPYFHPITSITLDAKGFEWSYVGLPSGTQPLSYSYDDKKITVQLGRTLQRMDTCTLELRYTAHPRQTGGSAAITSNQGLFFINPRGEEPEKPTQIWTQGETSWNSRWFPVIDAPNERCTQEMWITVPARYKTLSNGVLVSEELHSDTATRTDYWRMDQPHAPYLFMLAVGDFAVVKDTWRNKEVLYFVEPAFETSARAIFAHTPEMLEFFSTKLGVEFPWSKYAQIVVRDYVSGAMENTTAVVFGDFVQKHARELIDNGNDDIVAHEMFHHWFGDLVTCESWSNLTMNEGFANYSEYLWTEHKYGRDAADLHLLEEWQGYLATSPENMHPLIHFGVANEEDMFDAHSYNKGGAVLHMLRHYLGDAVFFEGLNRYLKKNAFQAVEAHQLRLAFEEVSGEDLNWFFNQWYFSKGHPTLKITYGYDAVRGEASVQVAQTQNPDRNPAIFELPLRIAVYEGGKVTYHTVRINQRIQEFRFAVTGKPDLIQLDPDRMLLSEFTDNKSEAEWVFQFLHAPRFLDRYEALSRLMDGESNRLAEVIPAALRDSSWFIRAMGLESVDEKQAVVLKADIARMAQFDSHAEVRASALTKLVEADSEQALVAAKRALSADSAYSVMGIALEVIHSGDPEAGLAYAALLEKEESEDLLVAISAIYKEYPDAKYLPFFEKNLSRPNEFNALNFIGNYQEMCTALGGVFLDQGISTLRKMALDSAQNPWRRLGATKSLNDFRNIFRTQSNQSKQSEAKLVLEKKVSELTRMLDEIKTFEPNEELKAIYQQLELLPKGK